VAAPGTAAATSAPPPLLDLGTVTTAGDLVRAFLTAGFGAARSAGPAARPCAAYPPPVATATFNGKAGYVVRVDGPSGRSTVVIVDERVCTPLLEAALPTA
jgi:hypothetical protein